MRYNKVKNANTKIVITNDLSDKVLKLGFFKTKPKANASSISSPISVW